MGESNPREERQQARPRADARKPVESLFPAVLILQTEKGTPNGVPFSVSKVGMVGLKSPEQLPLLTPDFVLL